jgi:O-antigen/teichoic acid export membrane protein
VSKLSKNSTKNFSYVAIANGLGTLLQAGFYFIFAALLNPEDYGFLIYIIAIGGTASVISRFGLPTSSLVFISKEKFNLSNQANILTLITTGIASIILIPINIHAALICLSLSFFAMNIQNLLGLKKYKKYFTVYLTKSVSIIIFPVILFLIYDIYGILLGMIIGNFIGGINMFKTLNFKINKFKDLKNNIRIIIHNFMVDTSMGLPRSIDKIVIVPILGLTSVAYYQFNFQIILVTTILPMALYSFLLSEESSGIYHKKIQYYVIIISGIFVGIIVLFSPILLEIFFPKFSSGVQSLQVMAFVIIPFTLSAILNAKLQSMESQKIGYASITKIGSLVIFLILLGSQFGDIGLAFALLISASIESGILYYFYLKRKH